MVEVHLKDKLSVWNLLFKIDPSPREGWAADSAALEKYLVV